MEGAKLHALVAWINIENAAIYAGIYCSRRAFTAGQTPFLVNR